MFDLSSLRLPVVQAPMAGGPSTPQLAGAVAEGGGLGSLATGYLSPAAAEAQLAAFRSLSTGPVAVNVFVPEQRPTSSSDAHDYRSSLESWCRAEGIVGDIPAVPLSVDDEARADYSSMLAMLERTAPQVVTFTFGLPGREDVARLQAAGVQVGVTVTTVEEALQAVDHGADLLIAQGIEAGGHRSQFDQSTVPSDITTEDLVRSIAGACGRPVVGAGGVDGPASAQRLLDAGASAVQLGTLFLTAREAGTKTTHRTALLDPGDRGTVLTRVFTGRPARALSNRFTTAMEGAAVAGYPQVHVLTGGIRAAAAVSDDPELLHLWAGTGFAACADETAASVLSRFDALRRPEPRAPGQSGV
ncbi:NAD(P)H-dependent flavin oxidoreductase [Brevibacterium senegalense]|uniref:NAD(P)H-dependent flavin oxidoreductase n=1 Tax=Brevibacterium senegalense TaxID=1033736 RepID=UPI0013755277|nr:nitronate monooxygenase [Brevibacterium senegalense]